MCRCRDWTGDKNVNIKYGNTGNYYHGPNRWNSLVFERKLEFFVYFFSPVLAERVLLSFRLANYYISVSENCILAGVLISKSLLLIGINDFFFFFLHQPFHNFSNYEIGFVPAFQ